MSDISSFAAESSSKASPIEDEEFDKKGEARITISLGDLIKEMGKCCVSAGYDSGDAVEGATEEEKTKAYEKNIYFQEYDKNKTPELIIVSDKTNFSGLYFIICLHSSEPIEPPPTCY
mgnify:CR=1 FL=1